MASVWLVLCNVPDVETARSIATKLVESRAAACVSIGSRIQSIYRWQGAIEAADEVQLTIKIDSANYDMVETIIRANHPYQLPEILAVPVTRGLPAYLDWVSAESNP